MTVNHTNWLNQYDSNSPMMYNRMMVAWNSNRTDLQQNIALIRYVMMMHHHCNMVFAQESLVLRDQDTNHGTY